MGDERVKLCSEQSFQCSICCNEISETNQISQIELCQCQFCRECLKKYFSSQLNALSIPIRCPNIDCNNLVSINDLRFHFDDSQFRLYEKLILEQEVTNDPRRLFCPHTDCGNILQIQDETLIQQECPLTCSKCRTTFCLKCRAPWHPNVQCSDMLTPYEMEADCNIKRCPRCRFPLEWIAGCAQIMCVNCKHIFCWYCLKSLDNDFFLFHFESGPCRNRLGHSRGSLFLHRLTIVAIFIGIILLFIIAIPFLLMTAPCLLCCQYKKIKNRLKNFSKFGQRFQQQQYTPTAHPTPSASVERLNSSSLIDIEQNSKLLHPETSVFSSSHFSDRKTTTEISAV